MKKRISNENTPEFLSENIDGYFDDQISYYKEIKHRDEELWEDFCLDFARWERNDFKKISSRKREFLWSLPRDNDVCISKSETIADGLTKLLDATDFPEWSREELTKIIAVRQFNPGRNPDFPGSYAYRRSEEDKATKRIQTCQLS